MKVLVIGSGGREHTLCWAIAKSPKCSKLYCAPGNAGISGVAECVPIKANDIERLLDFSKAKKIDFVVVGPEAPLVAGIVDELEEIGIKAFGPSAAAARIEGSKIFMKDLCAKYDIPTAESASFNECDTAKEYIRAHGAPIVIKADGLASGKGVILCRNVNEAFAAIDHIMTERAFGAAGDLVIIEELLHGEEASFFALVDGHTALPLVSAQDHKSAFDGNTGPNTGGMGAYTPTPVMTPEIEKAVMRDIIRPTVNAMAAEGHPYKGVLYAGLMIDDGKPKLLEYNARFGDPECQPIMMRLKSDALEMLLSCAEGRLDKLQLDWHAGTAMVVVMANKGYPMAYERGSEIKGLESVSAIDNVTVFHAGTKANGNKILADGGRVLGITALASGIVEARKKAYSVIDRIDWPQGFYRHDIGWRALDRK